MTGSTSASAGWDQSPERGEGNPAAVETGGGSKGTVSPQEASPADSPQQSPFPQVSRGVRSQGSLREGRCGEQVVGFRETWGLGSLSVPGGGGQQLWAQGGAPGASFTVTKSP